MFLVFVQVRLTHLRNTAISRCRPGSLLGLKRGYFVKPANATLDMRGKYGHIEKLEIENRKTGPTGRDNR
jgi:hypothetical protein